MPDAQGGPGISTDGTFETYWANAVAGVGAPIVVAYEHQYLAKQFGHAAATGAPDTAHVLLYPNTSLLTQPEFIGLTGRSRELGELLDTDPGLRGRATELGFRVTGAAVRPTLNEYLGGQCLPVPDYRGGTTGESINLPAVDVLDRMINVVGGCS